MQDKPFGSHIEKRKKVSRARIITRKIDEKSYYEIEYKETGKDEYDVGYGSYDLNNVISWFNECFEFCGKTKVASDNDGWIPVSEKFPEEKGWYQCTCSDKGIWNDDIVRDLYYYPEIKEFVDNIRYETNGLKNIENFFWTKYVTAWQQQPKPYKAKEES